jgi:hypothetical protein
MSYSQQAPQPPLRPAIGTYRQPPADDQPPEESGDAMDCPECGLHLVDMAHRRKHAIYHYGEGNIPRYANHTTAAERKGQLLDVDPQSLRG